MNPANPNSGAAHPLLRLARVRTATPRKCQDFVQACPTDTAAERARAKTAAVHILVKRGYLAIVAVGFLLLIPQVLEMTSLFRPGELPFWTPAWMTLGCVVTALGAGDYACRYELALLAPLREHPAVCSELRRLADEHAHVLALVRERTRGGRQLRVFDLVALEGTLRRQDAAAQEPVREMQVA